MKKNTYIAAALAVAVLAGALYLAFGSRAFAESDDEHDRGNGNAFGIKGKLGEDFRDVEKGFSKVFERASGISPAEVPQSIAVNPQGDVRLTGAEVTAVSGNQLTVKLWGWNLTVDRTNAQIIGKVNIQEITGQSTSTATSTAEINVGDKLLVKGTVNSTTGVVTASWIKNLSLQQQGIADIQSRISQLLQLIQQLQARLRAGTGAGE